MWTRGKRVTTSLTEEEVLLLKAVARRIDRSESATLGLSLRLFDRLIPNKDMWHAFQKTSFKDLDKGEVLEKK